jgi:NDP-sugar pyrophosphorylase family protein
MLRDLSSTGLIRQVVFTHPGTNDDIRLYVGDGSDWGVRAEYLAPHRWGGTAAAIVSLLTESPQTLSSPFLVIYGDSLLRMDYNALVEFHIKKGASMTIACHRPRFDAFLFEAESSDRQRTNFGIAELQPNGLVTHFEEKPYLDTITTSFTHPVANAAVYVIDPQALLAVPRPRDSTFDLAYDVIPWLVANGERIAGMDIAPGFRIDLGTLSNYLSVHLAMLRGYVQMPDANIVYDSKRAVVHSGATVTAPVFLGEGAQIGNDAVVESTVVGERSVIQEGASIRESVILADAIVGAGAVIEGSIVGPHTQVSAGAVVPRGTVTSAWSRIGGPELVLPQDVVQGLFLNDSGEKE